MEIGPYRLRDKEHLEYSNGSWDEFANVLFVDNPVGTGFSYVNTDSFLHELKDMADQFVTFLEKFFALLPEYETNDVSCEIYISEASANFYADLHCWRILCRTTHPIRSASHPRPKYVSDETEMESLRPLDWQWLDITGRSISRLPRLCLQVRPCTGRLSHSQGARGNTVGLHQ